MHGKARGAMVVWLIVCWDILKMTGVHGNRCHAASQKQPMTQADPKRIAAAHKSFAAISPGLASSHNPAVTQACMRPCPDDGNPMLGKIPGTENAYMGMGRRIESEVEVWEF